ncbi:SUMO-activating enzyme subunit 1-like [Onychostruthus taczanowskii]|uniref:SUMO-activating enzyme subunit 1-like n=1 Tax=Onychostruthus taczanowskii TaxID=356909 RepID=UPI001B809E11|nr:SUMO-activating enzyme subunit 1-like [Onychostruthus taczanowskii]
MVRINQICHKNGIKFFTGDVFGYHGYMFADLGEHEFVEEKPKVAKVSTGVEDGPEAKRARLEPAETTMVKKVSDPKTLKPGMDPKTLGYGPQNPGIDPKTKPQTGPAGAGRDHHGQKGQ